ncbi:WXG100 family type VII secretion target [Nocardioides sp. LHG3406-4]|uniref:WXG100 family type VII secretion target n=1 Tax=Nocardioides sp. LHG3406-4 TaxID=2804575 RepID=UPI003CFAE6F6
MTDPEIEYQRLTSGDAASLRSAAATLESTMSQLDGVRTELADVCVTMVWTGSAANVFQDRALGLRQGVVATRAAIGRARGALETSASAYEIAVDDAGYYIGFWRNRPTLPPVIEELFARVVNARLLSVGVTYNEQLAGVSAVLSGEEVDLDELDEDTREWVEKGLAKNDDWLGGNDSSLGPLIPNTAATGDDRGLVPQGLGYVPGTGSGTGTLVQTYWSKDGSYLALIDEATGREIGEAQLGTHQDEFGNTLSDSRPTHAGGVTVDGDNVYVTDKGEIYTYSLKDLRNASASDPVPQSAPPITGLDGGSYSTMKDGRLYMGDHGASKLYVYERSSSGDWEKVDTVETPADCQGVLVRDGEYVFSSSLGRDNGSSLIVQNRSDETDRSEPYDLPNMSQGVVEVNGDLVVTYESGAEEYDHMKSGDWGWLWGVPDDDSLWANPYMTRTPLSDLGLTEDFEVEPSTLTKAANDLDSPASTLASAASILDSVHVQAHMFGEVPKAAAVSKAVNQLVEFSSESVLTGAKAVGLAGDNLATTANDYLSTDGYIGSSFRSGAPR